MCGLAFVATKKQKQTGKRVYDLYAKQKSRGKDGFGYITIQDGKLTGVHRALNEDSIKETIFNETAEMILFHHRFPTSTPNTKGTTHPIFVSNDELEYDYYVMHNGVISNHKVLHDKHVELGYKYTTEYEEQTFAKYKDSDVFEYITNGVTKYNDSECLAIEIARYFETKSDCIDITGAAAVMGVVLKKGTDEVIDVFYGQNFGRSLARQDRKGWTLIASEGPGKEVKQMSFFHINPKTFETFESEMKMDEGHQKKHYGYHYDYEYTYRSPSTVEPKQVNLLPAANEYGLVNAIYTYTEAIDSGAPFTEFEYYTNQLIGEKNVSLWIPKTFIGHPGKRPFFADDYERVDLDPTPDKNRERLEELAMKYARKEYGRNKVNDMYQEGRMDHETYDPLDKRIEIELLELEEEMSTLGIDTEEVEDTLQQAQEFVEEEYSERIK